MTPAPKTPFFKVADFMQRSDVWSRIGLCALTTGILYFVMFGWEPPFSYRIRQAPLRDLHANTLFEDEDARATFEKRERTKRNFKNFTNGTYCIMRFIRFSKEKNQLTTVSSNELAEAGFQ